MVGNKMNNNQDDLMRIDEIRESMRAVTATSNKNERGEFTNPDAILRMQDLLAQLREMQ